jgi:hypothetical protein
MPAIIMICVCMQSATATTATRILRVCDRFKVAPAGTSTETLTQWKTSDDKLLQFLQTTLPEALLHTGATAFDDHLTGVQLILRHWRASEDVCRAGLFHSIYGTEGYQGFKLPLFNRPIIRELIGEKAEKLVWMFCMVDRLSVDDTLFLADDMEEQEARAIEFTSRAELGRFPIELVNEEEWLDFLELSLADWLEQVEGAAERENPLFEWKAGEAWSYRRVAYEKMVDILMVRRGARLQVARDTYDAI